MHLLCWSLVGCRVLLYLCGVMVTGSLILMKQGYGLRPSIVVSLLLLHEIGVHNYI
jgi:hypothetical protein